MLVFTFVIQPEVPLRVAVATVIVPLVVEVDVAVVVDVVDVSVVDDPEDELLVLPQAARKAVSISVLIVFIQG